MKLKHNMENPPTPSGRRRARVLPSCNLPSIKIPPVGPRDARAQTPNFDPV